MMRALVNAIALAVVALLFSTDPVSVTTTKAARPATPGSATPGAAAPAPPKRAARKSAAGHAASPAPEAPGPTAGQPAAAAPAPAPGPAPAPAPSPSPSPEEDQLLVEQKCAKCHDASLAYTAELSDPQWKVHMKRMASRPGAAITDEQARRIHAYLNAAAQAAAERASKH
jgi:hypothetical protein